MGDSNNKLKVLQILWRSLQRACNPFP